MSHEVLICNSLHAVVYTCNVNPKNLALRAEMGRVGCSSEDGGPRFDLVAHVRSRVVVGCFSRYGTGSLMFYLLLLLSLALIIDANPYRSFSLSTSIPRVVSRGTPFQTCQL